MSIYLDNAATTQPCREAVKAVSDCLTANYGNPSSLHRIGLKAQLAVDSVRTAIGKAIAADPNCIYFTSGATESNNLAVIGAAESCGRRRRKIVTTAVEHPSVENAMRYLEEQGFEVTRIAPNSRGQITHEMIIDAVDENTCLVSVMLVNNETGYILPAKRAFYGIKRMFPDCITHCDAVQGFMKLPIKTSELGADLISLSGHKIYGPKGVGALYVRKGVRLRQRMLGGGQEKGLRSGTENVPAILGMGAAVNMLAAGINERYCAAERLKSVFLGKLSEIEGVVVNSDEEASPYIINISVPGYRSEILLHFLEDKEIYVSSGSACSKGAKSGVLGKFGISDELADSALRISIGKDTLGSDLSALAAGIKEAMQKLAKAR